MGLLDSQAIEWLDEIWSARNRTSGNEDQGLTLFGCRDGATAPELALFRLLGPAFGVSIGGSPRTVAPSPLRNVP